MLSRGMGGQRTMAWRYFERGWRAVVVAVMLVAGLALAHPGPPAHRASAAAPTPECGALPQTTNTWTALGSPYQVCPSGVSIGFKSSLVIDGSLGPVSVTALGQGGLHVNSGSLSTQNTNASSAVTFTGPSPTAGSWDGITNDLGTVTLAYASISYSVVGVGGPFTLDHVSVDHTRNEGVRGCGSLTGGTISYTGPPLPDSFTAPGGSGLNCQLGALSVSGASFHDNQGAAIFASGYPAGYPLSITGNSITRAGTAGAPGIQVVYASLPTIKNNTITASGTGSTRYPAMQVSNATLDLTGNLAGNTGSGNGLDAIELTAVVVQTDFTWITPTNSGVSHPLGYVVSGQPSALRIEGATMHVPRGGVIKSGGLSTGSIWFYGAHLDAAAGNAVLTSIRDNSVGLAMCPSSMVQDRCGSPAPGDWDGLTFARDAVLNSNGRGELTGATIRYATVALDLSNGGVSPSDATNTGLVLTDTTIDQVGDAIHWADSPLNLIRGVISRTNDLGALLNRPLPGYGLVGGRTLAVNGTDFHDMPQNAISAIYSPASISVVGATFERTGTTGVPAIDISGPSPVLQNNSITDSGGGAPPAPAIRIYSSTAIDLATQVTGNQGSGNGLDAIVLNATATASFSWITPSNSATLHPLGFFSSNLIVAAGARMTVPAGGIVKGTLGLNGTLDATAGGAVFTNLGDNSVGMTACPSMFVNAQQCGPNVGWNGITAVGSQAGIAITNGTLHGGALTMSHGAASAPGDAQHGLSLVGLTADRHTTITVDFTPSLVSGGKYSGGASLFFRASPLTITGITGQGMANMSVDDSPDGGSLGYDPLVISNNSLAAGAGIMVRSAGDLTLQNNSVSGVVNDGSLNGPIELRDVFGDLSSKITGNVGGGNDISALVLKGFVATGSFTWITPHRSAAPQTLGYVLKWGGLAFRGSGTLTLPAGAIVKAHNGVPAGGAAQIYMDTGSLDARAGGAVFTSLADDSVGDAICTGCPAPTNHDWSGISLHDGAFNGATFRHALSPLVLRSGATATLGSSSYALLFDGGSFSQAGTPPQVGVPGVPVTARAPFSITNSAFADMPGGGLAVSSAGTSVVSGDTFSNVGGTGIDVVDTSGLGIDNDTFQGETGTGILVENGSSASISRSLFDSHGGTAIWTMPDQASAAVNCVTVRNWSVGIDSNGKGVTVHHSNLYGNGVDLNAEVATNAEQDWWGQAGGPRPGQVQGAQFADTTNPSNSPEACAPSPPAAPHRASGHQLVVSNRDGRLEAVGLGADGRVWHAWEGTVNGGWSGWYSLGGPPSGTFVADPAFGVNRDGRLEIFVTGSDGAVYHAWQVTPGGGWSQFYSLGGVLGGDQVTSIATNSDGRLELFVLAQNGFAYHDWQSAGGGWSGWTWLGRPGSGTFVHGIAPGRNGDGRLEIAAVDANGALWHAWQTAPSAGWTQFYSLGTPPNAVLASGLPGESTNGDGRLEIVVRGTDDALWHLWQVSPSGGWSGFAPLGGSIASDPSAGRNGDGRLEVFATQANGTVVHLWQVTPGQGWTGVVALAGNGYHLAGTPQVGTDADGRLEVLAQDATYGYMDLSNQAAPSSGWNPWSFMSGTTFQPY